MRHAHVVNERSIKLGSRAPSTPAIDITVGRRNETSGNSEHGLSEVPNRTWGKIWHTLTGTGRSGVSHGPYASVHRRRLGGRFFNLVDLVNQLDQEKAGGRSGRLAEKLQRHDLIVIDELGYLPFSQPGGQALFHLISKLYENTRC